MNENEGVCFLEFWLLFDIYKINNYLNAEERNDEQKMLRSRVISALQHKSKFNFDLLKKIFFVLFSMV